MSTKSYCSSKLLERMMGKVSWIASIDRFFFSLFLQGYLLVSSLRKRNARPGTRVRLSRKGVGMLLAATAYTTDASTAAINTYDSMDEIGFIGNDDNRCNRNDL